MNVNLQLFPHNKKAYDAAEYLLEKEGKAAIIHPTGTGKSMIAFQLALNHAAKKVLWLAPSEYIFQTQLENIKRKCPVQENTFANVSFFTYAKLMHNEELIDSLEPDYIVLDEFHRCGAKEWGKSVEKLLSTYPDAKVLGLSATNIRYLDNQRDMAMELFEGNIASEMSLGEAIGKGILPAPTYVCTMYTYEEELKKLKKKIESQKNERQQKENEKLLEQLRRALENAEGLDQIFARHMKNKCGKYIVFCSGKEHMEEMISHAKTWFAQVDQNPHIYRAYYDSLENDIEFQQFREDDSQHLRLLYCIDMFNEGIHVDAIDGVILLRPTVSPILYLQQIGRALSTGRDNQPLIFDVVNNFESLTTIDSIREQAQEVYLQYGERNYEKKSFYEYFRVIDEIKESRRLFENLYKNLSATWDTYYAAALQYYQTHGNLQIPKSYVTETGLNLGSWLLTQKRVKAGKIIGALTEEQAARLEAIGMVWEDSSTHKFNYAYQQLCKYKEMFGDVDVKATYVTEDGFALGKWVSNTRSKWQRGEYEVLDEEGKRVPQNKSTKAKLLRFEQMEALNQLGMIWDKHAQRWNVNFEEAQTYWRVHGNLNVPRKYVTPNGVALGVWLDNQRLIAAGRKSGAAPMTELQKNKLNQIGMIWYRENTQISILQ